MLAVWHGFSDRERMMIGGLGVLVVLLVLVMGIINPILRSADQARSEYARALRVAELAEDLEPGGQAPSDQRALRTIVTNAAKRRNLVVTRINVPSEGAIAIDVANVPHATFYAWIQGMEREAGVLVTEAYVGPGDVAGTLEARLTMVKG